MNPPRDPAASATIGPPPEAVDSVDTRRRLSPGAPPEWTGSDEAFVRCLSGFASTVLEAIAARCDALQHLDRGADAATADRADFNAGVIAATRVVMAFASELRETNRPASEWTASKVGELAPLRPDTPGDPPGGS